MLRKSINRSLLLIENDRVDEMAMLRVLAKENAIVRGRYSE